MNKSPLATAKTVVLTALLFLFPVFFLPLTQEYFITGKLYLMAFGVLVLLAISLMQFLTTKKFVWERKPFDNAVVLFFTTVAVSTLISSPNKVQAILNPNFGVLSIFSFMVLYFYVSRAHASQKLQKTAILVSAFLLSLSAIVTFFTPFKDAKLPVELTFLKNTYFTPLGNQLDLVILLGFIAVYLFTVVMGKKENETKTILHTGLFLVTLGALGLTTYTIVRSGGMALLTPYAHSWYAAMETLKQPLTALFGVGVDNYAAMFTRVKDYTYNQSAVWQIDAFSASRSLFLHILTETGLFGAVSFALLMLQLVKSKTGTNRLNLLPLLYVIVVAVLFPPSLPLFFLLFTVVGMISGGHKTESAEEFTLDTARILPLYVGTAVVATVVILGTGYLVGRAYAAEYLFNKAVMGMNKNIIGSYTDMQGALVQNPFIERYHMSYSQLNLLIANNIAAKAQPPQQKEGQPAAKPVELSEQDRQNISQAIQAAISESKAVVQLNPYKALNWMNLAATYRNIIGVAQGADAWTISAYNRAITLDPQNALYRIEFGGLMFAFKSYDDASRLFEQAISIKPDYANGHYNLAWTLFQKENYQGAVAEMQTVVKLLDPKKDETDYKRAAADLEEMKKKLPKEETKAEDTQTTDQKTGKLALPTPPAGNLEPKLQLPKSASPEAK